MKAPLLHALRSYDAWLFAPSSGARMGGFRIAFALYMLAYLVALAPHVPLLFSHEGVYVPFLVPDLAPPPVLAWALFGAMLLLTCSLLLGYRAELSAGLLLGLYLHHYFLQLAVKQSAFERLIILYLAVLALAGAGMRYGLDGLRTRADAPKACTAWGERVIAAQSVFLYFGAGLWKLTNPAWHDGALLRSTFQGMWATPLAFELARLPVPRAAWTSGGFFVIALEIALGPLLLVRRTRVLGVALATAFHIGNCVLIFIPEFMVSVAALVVFLDEAQLQRGAQTLARLARRVRALITARSADAA